MRVGPTFTSREPFDATYPTTSISTCVEPEELYIEIRALVPSFTNAAFATVVPATKLTLLTSGSALSAGHTVRKPLPVGSTAVTFTATMVALTGTPAPVSESSRVT